MEPLVHFSASGVPLRLANVNTDQLFPARFIKKPRAVGYAQYLFHDIRRNKEGSLLDSFPLNQTRYHNSKILIGGANFGSGSSREGAVYALFDAGFRVIIAPSFGEIFAANCLKNGVLATCLSEEQIVSIQQTLTDSDDLTMVVNIPSQTLTMSSGILFNLRLDTFQKQCLIQGLNEIDLSLTFSKEIDMFEKSYRAIFPWTQS